MISGDKKLRDRLRDLPTSYLLDLLADDPEGDEYAIRGVLRERGLEPEEIAGLVESRTSSPWPRGYTLWRSARTFTLVCTFLLTVFNLTCYFRLLHGTSHFKGTLLLLSAAGLAFGFFVGFKLSTQVYHGARHHLHCGFPLPVGHVDLQTGQETVMPKPRMILRMIGNAVVGLNLVLFPLMLIAHFLGR